MSEPALDYHKALRDPEAVYESPEKVLGDPRLDAEGRRAILRAWESQIRGSRRVGRGAAERSDTQQRIRAALARLDAEHGTARRSALRTGGG